MPHIIVEFTHTLYSPLHRPQDISRMLHKLGPSGKFTDQLVVDPRWVSPIHPMSFHQWLTTTQDEYNSNLASPDISYHSLAEGFPLLAEVNPSFKDRKTTTTNVSWALEFHLHSTLDDLNVDPIMAPILVSPLNGSLHIFTVHPCLYPPWALAVLKSHLDNGTTISPRIAFNRLGNLVLIFPQMKNAQVQLPARIYAHGRRA